MLTIDPGVSTLHCRRSETVEFTTVPQPVHSRVSPYRHSQKRIKFTLEALLWCWHLFSTKTFRRDQERCSISKYRQNQSQYVDFEMKRSEHVAPPPVIDYIAPFFSNIQCFDRFLEPACSCSCKDNTSNDPFSRCATSNNYGYSLN